MSWQEGEGGRSYTGVCCRAQAGGVAGLWVQRLVSTISWRRFGGLRKVTEGGPGWMDLRRGSGSLL